MADATDSKSVARKGVRVQVPPPVPDILQTYALPVPFSLTRPFSISIRIIHSGHGVEQGSESESLISFQVSPWGFSKASL